LKIEILCLGAEVKSSVEDPMEVEVAEGYTMAQFCDKIIDLFLNEKPKVKQWKTYLVLRDEWNKYSVNFYKRCRIRADTETDPILKQKLVSLESKVKKVFIVLYFVFISELRLVYCCCCVLIGVSIVADR